GVVKNATKDGMVNLEAEGDEYVVKAYTTGIFPNATICLKSNGKVLFETRVDMNPEMSFEHKLSAEINMEDCYLAILDEKGNAIVEWQTAPTELKPIPDAAKAAKKPEEINSVEQLYLRGLHLEQYRHATFNPVDYYMEGLKREPSDVRCNNAMGAWYMKRGQFALAEPFFRKAIETLTERNPNPYDGEPLYNLGLCLRYKGELKEAYDHFFKSTWNGAWQDSGFFHCAQIDAINGNDIKALDLVERSLIRNWVNQKARHLKIMLLRRANRIEEASALIEESLKMDQFNFGAIYEKYLITKDETIFAELKELMRDYVHNFIEFSLDYAQAGFYQEAIDFINIHLNDKSNVYPMAQYFHGYYHHLMGADAEALASLELAAKMDPEYCFPNKLEELIALQYAMSVNPTDSKAHYYAGNFWYGARQYDNAVTCWETSRDLDASFPTVHRNLALAYYNKQNDPQKARVSLETAYELDKTDARILMELDQLYKKMGDSLDFRLSVLEANLEAVNFRDDLYLERATLLNLKGECAKALELIMARQFHPWEGGEGKVTGQYLYAHIELAKEAIAAGLFEKAIDHLKATEYYPHNLGEGKLPGAQENDIHFWMGVAYEGLGDKEMAKQYFEMATIGQSEPTAALYYNDQQPDKIYYQGLALEKLGRHDEARGRYNKLVKYGEKQLFIPFEMDYFAVSLPDLLIFEEDMQKRHEQHCHYLIALGYLGLKNSEKSMIAFDTVLGNDSYHVGSIIHKKLINNTLEVEA
ncbi:tetratricopeptide repeat protein, partial [Persicobacter diffluens]|uniref:tetratricopeptide repeat protein n=1 Tax=Persicobacter diffluens TaxID=981 RepID=UPI0030C67CB3